MHDDYPLAPEKLEISQDMLSEYCSSIANEHGIKFGGKSKYVLYFKNLQLNMSLGTKLVSVYRTPKFKLSNCLKGILILKKYRQKKKILSIVLKIISFGL